MAVAWLASILTVLAQSQVPSREERVLELLRSLEQEVGSWRYLGANFAPWPPDSRQQQLVPSYFLMCATESRDIDDARFRRLALEVLRIYDLAPASDVALADKLVSVQLDGLDPEHKIGFELRGRGDPESRNSVSEGDSEILDDAEVDRLRAMGFRLYVVDRDRYSDDEDGFTPALAFLAGLVGFLNEVTDGEDIDLGGLMFVSEATWSWTIVPADGMRLESGNYGPVLVVERSGTVSIPCRGMPDLGPPRTRLDTLLESGLRQARTLSTLGAPSVVVVKSSVSALEKGSPRPEFRVRYRQTLGAQELVHECRSFVAFLPRGFDLTQPFALELDLAPGRYSFYGGAARIGGSAARR